MKQQSLCPELSLGPATVTKNPSLSDLSYLFFLLELPISCSGCSLAVAMSYSRNGVKKQP